MQRLARHHLPRPRITHRYPNQRFGAPLVDAGQIRIEGYIPQGAKPIAKYRSSLPVTLTVFVSESGKSLILRRDVQNKLDALHATVRRGYEDAADYTDADMVNRLANRLGALTRQQLLPETHLLLALLPGIAREKRVAQGIRGMARLRELLGALHIGAPLHHENLTVLPLVWPDLCKPTYTVLVARRDFAWLGSEGSVVTVGGSGEAEWWTFAGACANAALANELAQIARTRVDHDSLSLSLQSSGSAENIEAAIAELRARDAVHMQPEVDEEAIAGLKFNECLPPETAVAMLQARLRNAIAIESVLREPVRFVVS